MREKSKLWKKLIVYLMITIIMAGGNNISTVMAEEAKTGTAQLQEDSSGVVLTGDSVDAILEEQGISGDVVEESERVFCEEGKASESITEEGALVEVGVFNTFDASIDYIRERMVKREGSIGIIIDKSSLSGSINSELEKKCFVETNNPKEGDYLYRHLKSWNVQTITSGDKVGIVLRVSYLSSAVEEFAMDKEVQRLLTTGQLKGLYNASDYAKVKKVYDYLTAKVKYDNSLTNYSAYSALIEGDSVCQGISTSMYRLCRELGVSSRVITSTLHAWNIVKIGNYYYNLDATWDLDENMAIDTFFLRGSGSKYFNSAYYYDHKRESMYNTSSFNNKYPMSTADYKIKETDSVIGKTKSVSVTYSTHVQSYGWTKGWSTNGVTSGTSGEGKRLEGIKIQLQNTSGLDLGIRYKTHVQSYGWLDWSANGAFNGTEGQAKRLEAIKIELTGEDAALYNIYYRVHAQSYGWLGWAKNGESAGTAGQAKRLEAIEIKIIPKTQKAPTGVMGYSYIDYGKTADLPTFGGVVNYVTHVQSYGWQEVVNDGSISGTFGEGKRLESIIISTSFPEDSLVYRTHVQGYGWLNWVKEGDESGTVGEGKRLEAIQIKLQGTAAKEYDIYYRVHAQSYGWLGWAKNGAEAGTAGLAKRLEAIQIVMVPKGSTPPGNTDNCYITK